MSEPPLPITPTGEVRDFNLVLPPTPDFDTNAPGSQDDPSGAAAVTECQAQLEALVAAINTDPTTAEASALFAFIEYKTGQSIEDLLGTTWADLIADGETVTVRIEIPLCNAIVELTLGGDLNTTATCEYLPTLAPISFGKNDFDMPEVITDSGLTDSLSSLPSYSQEITRHADIHVHLEDPEFVYLETYFYGGGADQTLSNAIGSRIGVYQRAEYQCIGIQDYPPETGGISYCPWWRIKGWWTCKIEETHRKLRTSGPSGTFDTNEWEYSTNLPLMGFHPVIGLKDVPEDTVSYRDIDDPVVLGVVNPDTGTEVYTYGMNEAGIGLGVDSAPFQGYTGSELPNGGSTTGGGNGLGPNGRTNGWNLPQMAIGEPDLFTPGGTGGLPPESPGIYNWTVGGGTGQVSTAYRPYFSGFSQFIQQVLGGTLAAGTKQDAWDEFVGEIEEYQAFAGPYDPVVELDEENMEVRVSFETDLNALHLPPISCMTDFFFPDGTQSLDRIYKPAEFWTMSWGGYWHDLGWGVNSAAAAYDDTIPFFNGNNPNIPGAAGNYTAPGNPHEGDWYMPGPQWQNALAARIARDWPEDNAGWARTNTYMKPLPRLAGTYTPIIEADEVLYPTDDGDPPPTSPNPPITPIGGGCRSYLEGPSSCTWNIPVPASPQPEVPEPETPDAPQPPIPPLPPFPMPGDHLPLPGPPKPPDIDTPDAPVIDVQLPNIPKLPCIVPDFNNIDPCGAGNGGGRSPRIPTGPGGGAGPGTLGPLPGGRDRMGHRGSGGTVASVKTGGQTYAARDYLFTERTCPGVTTPGIGSMAVIVQLLMDCGIAPIDIIFQIGPEWDKPFPPGKCFTRGSRIFDAAMWTARFLMCTIVDEGPPTNDVYIGPPWHRPLQTVWTFDEHYDLFNISRGFSAEEGYGWLEVFGPNVTTPIIVRIEDPFSTVDSPTLRMEVGANYSQTDAEGLAAYRAGIIMRESVSIQATVPYSSDYFLRDLMLIQAPDRGFQETYVITGKESDVSSAGRFHLLTGMLPATLAELDAFPEVTDEYDAIEGGFA